MSFNEAVCIEMAEKVCSDAIRSTADTRKTSSNGSTGTSALRRYEGASDIQRMLIARSITD